MSSNESASSIAQVGEVGSFFSLVAECWFFFVVFRYKIYTPMVKLITMFCFIHFGAIIFFSVGFSVPVCVAQFLAVQVFVVGTWFVSTCAAFNLLAGVYFKFGKKNMRKLQYLFYSICPGIPILLTVILVGSGEMSFGANNNGVCFTYNHPSTQFVTYVGLFFLLMLINIIIFVLITYKILVISSQSKEYTKQENKRTFFYVVLFLCLGFFRLPAIFFFIYTAAEITPPLWTSYLLEIFLPLEGFVVVIAVSNYFSIFSRWVKSFRKTPTDKDLITAKDFDRDPGTSGESTELASKSEIQQTNINL